jgi:hypothetical protein
VGTLDGAHCASSQTRSPRSSARRSPALRTQTVHYAAPLALNGTLMLNAMADVSDKLVAQSGGLHELGEGLVLYALPEIEKFVKHIAITIC